MASTPVALSPRTSARSRTNISGPLVKTIMNRCIQCTRCVRFIDRSRRRAESSGATGRGEDMEITTYLEQAMTSELQGNVVDLCPVGALTSKPYAFAARPWELRQDRIDRRDGRGRLRHPRRYAGREVMRILPRLNEAVNEEWISDKTASRGDGLRSQRLDQPYIRENGRCRLRRGTRRSLPSPHAKVHAARSASAPSPVTSPLSRKCSR